ncbi:hypothetical protein [Paraburkholderia sp. RL17-373-BIF-A]|uniref:hypothetical protein n=1 Tax=Paraburkholderia sp. RL17-373-BIF-A TaxID=3031629 RepID=UPI0038B812B8
MAAPEGITTRTRENYNVWFAVGRCGKGPWLRFRRWANDRPNDEMDHRAIGSKRRLSSRASANEALQLTGLRGLDGFPGRLTPVKAVGMRVPMAGNEGLGTK